MGELSRLIYVDDSGAWGVGDNLVVYGWVEVAPVNWRGALRVWLDLRKYLWREYKVPVSQELHCTRYINGRDRISARPPAKFRGPNGQVLKKDLGREVAVKCLETLRDCADISVGAIFKRLPGVTGVQHGAAKYDVYGDLVRRTDTQLSAADSYGFLTMDGSDLGYRAAHRDLKLDTRHVVEDPAFHDSKMSQWTQMADLVAYVTYLHLQPHPSKAFAKTWYSDYLQGSDVNGAPLECL
ncbi:DUF3800 domain-containing protein [Phycicoccus sp. 3266]|uniref:DUF3800 domain-containing protein n=1 Tax=Phycicoccus sp. 3266 TaxID=2817751 RepID=UPI0028545BEB|nr:DUF3800 domain-containing protein [Phycicoccus sp. 3266]MDR6862167.1 hypothetical protein [Phycicoccus sp. 3266]